MDKELESVGFLPSPAVPGLGGSDETQLGL